MDGPATPAPIEATVEIVNQKGLHARASAKLATLAETFDARVAVSMDGETVDARSIMGLLMLAASKGSRLSLRAYGPEAPAAMAAIVELFAAGFGETSG